MSDPSDIITLFIFVFKKKSVNDTKYDNTKSEFKVIIKERGTTVQGPYFSIVSSHGNGFRIAPSYDISLARPKSNGHVFAFKKLIHVYLQPETGN